MGNFSRGLMEGLGQGLGLLIIAIIVITLIVCLVYWGVKSGFFAHSASVSIKNLVGL